MADDSVLDHLAIGVAEWGDGYDALARDLGGTWSHGGDAGEFAPYQLVYAHGMRLEVIAPGSQQGFMHRFIERDGAGPHHITFKVPSLERALDDVAELGIAPLGGRPDTAFWREAFLHPKACQLGTLIQLAEVDQEQLAALIEGSPKPPGFPERPAPQQTISWVGLTTGDLAVARALLLDVLDGVVEAGGEGWMLVTWGPGRRLLVRLDTITPGGAGLWEGAVGPGVAHIVCGPQDLSPTAVASAPTTLVRRPVDARLGVPIWIFEGSC